MEDSLREGLEEEPGEGLEEEPDLAGLELDDDRTFHAPWQARAFAVAVALSEAGAYGWSAFQSRLVDEIERADERGEGGGLVGDARSAEDDYYRQWLTALERILVEDGVIEPGELAARAAEFAEGDRDASEWVEGEHHHVDGHEGHEH